MLLCMLPSEEAFRWGRWGDKTLEDLPDMFYDFCWQRATELRTQVKSLEGIEEEPRVTALSSGYPRWLGQCILGEICGSYHMPEVCQMFEAMTPEGRLSVNQKEEAVPVLPSAPRHAAMSLTFPAGLPYQRMHADAPYDVAQGSVARGGQTCCARDGTGCRRPQP